MIDRNSVFSAIQHIFQESDYFDYLFRNISSIGFKFENEGLVINFSYSSGKIECIYLAELDENYSQIWLIIPEEEILSYPTRGESISHLKLETINTRRKIHPALEQIILKIFQSEREIVGSIAEREDLIYASLFSFKNPEILWTDSSTGVRVLSYCNSFEQYDVCVTSGLSNPNIGNSPISADESEAIGYGYELIIFSPTNLGNSLKEELVGWAKYILTTKNHILRGNWLEYHEGIIPGTNLGGFIVVEPEVIPEYFPILDGICFWNLLIGVTPKELEVAKEYGAEYLADKLGSAGYSDFTVLNRDSVSIS